MDDFDSDGLDPWEGAQRPGPEFSLSDLPPLIAKYRRRRRFSVQYFDYNANDFTSSVLTDKQARVHLENCMTRLRSVLTRARFYPPRDCYFDVIVNPHTGEAYV